MPLGKIRSCDICGITPDVIIDAVTRSGRWAWMCEECWRAKRMYTDFGTGHGQKFANEPGGRKLEG